MEEVGAWDLISRKPMMTMLSGIIKLSYKEQPLTEREREREREQGGGERDSRVRKPMLPMSLLVWCSLNSQCIPRVDIDDL